MKPAFFAAVWLLDSNQADTGMNYVIWFAVFFLVILPLITGKRNEAYIYRAINSRKDKGVSIKMVELAKRFTEKECIIYMFNGNQYTGVIKEVLDNAILVDKDGDQEIINLDFVSRIREFPRNKKGKKKSVVLD